ncbi:MAG: hypothetical protein V7L11_14930 [Nostoc sp.]
MGIGHWAIINSSSFPASSSPQSLVPSPQSPIPSPQSPIQYLTVQM